MPDPDDDDDEFGQSPDMWTIELNNMTFAAFGDLTRAVTGIDYAGNLFQPTPQYIEGAFSLLASGTEIPLDEFAEHRAAFLAALDASAEHRAQLLQAALDNLSDMLGFTPEAPEVIAAFKLPEDPQA